MILIWIFLREPFLEAAVDRMKSRSFPIKEVKLEGEGGSQIISFRPGRMVLFNPAPALRPPIWFSLGLVERERERERETERQSVKEVERWVES